jgi:hypothetical protein
LPADATCLATATVICRRSAATSALSLISFIAHASIQEVAEVVDNHRASEVP